MTKLCPRGKAAAKRKFKVYPSAYANAYASKICAGKIKDHLTGSAFPTYITEVGLYDDAEDLIGIAKLSKPIPKSRKIPMRFFVRMDY